MNFGQLCNEVMTITGRPDLAADTQLAVRRATLYLHGIDTWFRDFAEKRVAFDAVSYNFSINITREFTNFRKLRYIKPFDTTTGTVKKDRDIKFMSPDNLWDEFSQDKKDIYYIAGINLNIRAKETENGFLVGYYTMPNVMDAFYSWIAELYPYAIVDEAAGHMLRIIGLVDEGNKYVDAQKGTVATIHIPWLRANGITPEA